MDDKRCQCQFCRDYKWLNEELLPAVPEQHRSRLEQFFGTAWAIDEELDYKKSILDGTWPSSVTQLEQALANAKALALKESQKQGQQV